MEEAPNPEQATPNGASRLPVFQSVLDTFWLLRAQAPALMRTGWLPFLVLSLCAFAVYFLKGEPDAGDAGAESVAPSFATSLLIFTLTAISIAADMALLVRWYRTLMLPRIPDQGLRLGRRELRVLLAMVGVAICALGPMAVVTLLLSVAGKTEDPAAALPLLLSATLSLWIYCRLMLVPALAALDAGGPLLAGSWRIMRGYALRAFAITALASIPLLAVGVLGLAVEGAAGLLVDLLVELLRTLLLVAVSTVVMHRIAPIVDPVY